MDTFEPMFVYGFLLVVFALCLICISVGWIHDCRERKKWR